MIGLSMAPTEMIRLISSLRQGAAPSFNGRDHKASLARGGVIKLHRWLSLTVMALWLVQAVTGMICVFHWELDDATIAAADLPTDMVAIGHRLAVIAPSGSGARVTGMWTSASGHNRWDVTVSGQPGAVVRIDGAGHILRIRNAGELIRDGGLLDSIDNIHQTLMAGDTGGWIIGVSGVLLLSNLALALRVAWPRRRQWRRALQLGGGANSTARLFGWHRALGLWLAVPAMLLVSTGVLRVFSDGFETLIGGGVPAAPVTAPGPGAITLAVAVDAAQARRPHARLAAVILPTAANATWQIRLDEPGEWSRAYGRSRVFVDGHSGRVIGVYDALAAPWPARIADAVLPLHTGEALGVPGRLGVLVLGGWLMTMIVLGARLWWARRRSRKRRNEPTSKRFS